jgi:hypothetical protein
MKNLMTKPEEELVHLRECERSLNEAWYILSELKSKAKHGAIEAAAYRYALVAYARPYTNSDGEYRNRKNRNSYKLPVNPNLSQEKFSLHQQIVDLRDQFLAHADITVKQASVHIARFGRRASVCIASSSVPAFPEIEAVISLIEHTLVPLYEKIAQHEEALAPAA